MTVPIVHSFFDEKTKNVSHIVVDPNTCKCAIIDPLLEYDPASGHTKTVAADKIVAAIDEKNLTVEWIIDTHVHADHLSAAHYLKGRVGGKMAIGENIVQVQEIFSDLFNSEAAFRADGSQFDHLFKDGETYNVGEIEAKAIHTPGHTPACMTHLIGDAAFVGDTLFMPDYGTARCDFPGGDAQQLYRSIRRIFELPDRIRVFLNHDYLPADRDTYQWETTIGEQKKSNIHVHEDSDEADFVKMRTERDKTLSVPQLIIPSVQINMRAGSLPPPEDNGLRYIKVPVNAL